MKLAILDISGLIEDAIELAPHAERLGYTRYWIAEHQPEPTPMLPVAIIAGVTDTIRVGTAGILLHYYPPLRTAHDFQFLERAFEGRIDAGFCGGHASNIPAEELDGVDIKAVAARYYARATRLVRHLRNLPGEPDFDPTTAWPGVADQPPAIWVMGSAVRSAEFAAEHGLSYAYSLLYPTSIDDPESIQRYRTRFVPGRAQPAPCALLAVCVVCTETAGAATAIAAALAGNFFQPRIVGDAASCRAQLAALQARYAPDELVVATLGLSLPERKRCLELLAEGLA
jgi:luciferase family oxidoreductase group 1